MSSLQGIALKCEHLDIDSLNEEILYIGVIGFEDRSLGFLNEVSKKGKKFKSCIAIEYIPLNDDNRGSEFLEFSNKIFRNTCIIKYDRFCPEDFSRAIPKILEHVQSVSHVILDVSAMSKFLIVILLHGLRKINLQLSIIYAPAKIYYPTKEGFEAEKAKIKDESSDLSPYFLTTDVYTVVTTTALSSVAMQGAPLAMVAFPNFNYREIAALLNETNAQKLFLIESIKDLGQNAWRLDAIRWINRGLRTYVTPKSFVLEASNVNANIQILERIYQDENFTHKIALSPTGGKMQAVATFCMKLMHPDIHIVYPVVRKFAQDYSEGYLAHTQIYFKSFSDYTMALDLHRKSAVLDMGELIRSKADLFTLKEIR